MVPCREGECCRAQRWCLECTVRALRSRGIIIVSVFASLFDQVREKKDVPLGPEDPKEEDGSFDYRCVICLTPGPPPVG